MNPPASFLIGEKLLTSITATIWKWDTPFQQLCENSAWEIGWLWGKYLETFKLLSCADCQKGPATFSSGDHAHLATENDGMQPRESESHIPQDRASRSGTSASYTGNFDNGTPGNSFRKFSTAEKCFLQPTQSNEQDTASQVQPVKCVPEEDDSILFSFDWFISQKVHWELLVLERLCMALRNSGVYRLSNTGNITHYFNKRWWRVL